MAVITAAVIGVAGTVYASNRAKKEGEKNREFAREQQEGLDPYAPYRDDAAKRLDALSRDSSSIVDTPEYKARMQAAARTVGAQGYTGSGNALVAAAEAGASVYQQAFDNLARLSGADVGIQSKAGVASASIGANQDSSNNYLSSIGGVVNNLGNLATVAGGRFNQPATGGSSQAATNAGSFVGSNYTGTGGIGF